MLSYIYTNVYYILYKNTRHHDPVNPLSLVFKKSEMQNTTHIDLIMKVYRTLGEALKQDDQALRQSIAALESIIGKHPLLQDKTASSEVNHPSHYRPGAYEAIDVIQSWDLNFSLGNVVKYICRAGLKDPEKVIQDLEKASFYLKAEINQRRINANDDSTSPDTDPTPDT